MATLIFAGFAFAFASKAVEELFPSSGYDNDEMERHDRATEAFNRAKQDWDEEVNRSMLRERKYDRLNDESENRKRISQENIQRYLSSHPELSAKRPVFQDFLMRVKPKKNGYSNLMRSVAVASMGGVATYLVIKYI